MARSRESEDRELVLAVARRVMAGAVPARGYFIRSEAVGSRFHCEACAIDRPETVRTLVQQGWFGRTQTAFQFTNTILHPIQTHDAAPPAELIQQARMLLTRFPYYLNPENEVD